MRLASSLPAAVRITNLPAAQPPACLAPARCPTSPLLLTFLRVPSLDPFPVSMLSVSFSRWSARRARTLITVLAAIAGAVFGQTPSAVDGFNPDVDGNVFVLLAQADGKVLVGGQFTTISGTARNNVARL